MTNIKKQIQKQRQLKSCTELLPGNSGINDLVLLPDLKKKLSDILTLCNKQESFVKALFAGDKNSQKTLSASALAYELHKSCYRVNLSTIESKYIGETEKS